MKSALIAAVMAFTILPSSSVLATPSESAPSSLDAPLALSIPDSEAPLTTPPAGPVHFPVGGDVFVASAPQGYCDPAGALAAVSSTMTAWSQRAHLDLGAIWVSCDFHNGAPGPIRMAFVAAKGSGPKAPFGRKVFVKALADAIPTPAAQAMIARGLAKGADGSPDPTLVTKLANQPRLMGVDDLALYILVDANQVSETNAFQFSVLEAMTLIKGRIAVFVYVVVRGSEADKAEMLVNAKREVAKFVAMNGG